MSENRKTYTIAEAWQRANRRNGVPVRDTMLSSSPSGLVIRSTVGSQHRAITVKTTISLDDILKFLPKIVDKAQVRAAEKARKEIATLQKSLDK